MPKETAEQKLLKLIETADSADQPGGGDQASPEPEASPEAQQTLASVKSVGVGLPSVSMDGVTALLKGPLSFLRSPSTFGIRELNTVMILLILGLGAYFVSDFSRGVKLSKKEFHFDETVDRKTSSELVLPEIRDLAEYASAVSERNIFHPYEEKVVQKKQDAVTEKNIVIKNKAQNLKLVGVSWFDSAETATAMIEDGKTSITHFLKVGDKIQDVTIQKIFADQVILSYQDETLAIGL